MNIKDNHNNKKVTFNILEGLEDKIDRLTVMMRQLTMKDKSLNSQFKPEVYQGRGRGQSRNFYNRDNYDQQGHQNMYGSNCRDRRTQFNATNQYGQNRG